MLGPTHGSKRKPSIKCHKLEVMIQHEEVLVIQGLEFFVRDGNISCEALILVLIRPLTRNLQLGQLARFPQISGLKQKRCEKNIMFWEKAKI